MAEKYEVGDDYCGSPKNPTEWALGKVIEVIEGRGMSTRVEIAIVQVSCSREELQAWAFDGTRGDKRREKQAKNFVRMAMANGTFMVKRGEKPERVGLVKARAPEAATQPCPECAGSGTWSCPIRGDLPCSSCTGGAGA